MVQNKKLKFPYSNLTFLSLRDNHRLLFCCCCSSCSFQKFSLCITIFYCTSDITLDRLLQLISFSGKIRDNTGSHGDCSLRLKTFLPYLPDVSPTWLSPQSLTSFPIFFATFLPIPLSSPEFFPCLPLSLVSLLSSTQVFSHCLMCSTSQISGFGESFVLGSKLISSLFVGHSIDHPPHLQFSTLMLFVKICSFPSSIPFLSEWTISFSLYRGVDIQIRSGSE